MSSVPPGWYPDPSPPAYGSPHLVRWWDGTAWTAHAQPAYGDPHAGRPAAAPGPAGPTTPDGEPLGGWWWRVLAVILDSMLIGVVGSIVTVPVQISVQREVADRQRELEADLANDDTVDFGDFFGDTLDIYADHLLGLFLLPLLVGLAYYAIFLRWRGATPGKMICGLRVRLRDQPGRLPYAAIAVRLALQSVLPSVGLALAFASGSVPVFLLAYLATLGYALTDALWATRPRRQALHDLAARTVVVRTR